jgi:hypothetical protein
LIGGYANPSDSLLERLQSRDRHDTVSLATELVVGRLTD